MSKKKEVKLTDDDCYKWKLDKSINPITRYKIQKGKSVYKELEKQCKHIKTPVIHEEKKKIIEVIINGKKYDLDENKCNEWLTNNKQKNPFTNHRIGINSPIIKILENGCNKLGINEKVLKKEEIDEDDEDEEDEDDKEIEDKKKKDEKNPKYIPKKAITEEDCIKWKKNKLRNPLTKTNSKIKENGPIYNKFKTECEHIKTPELKKKEDKVISKSSSKSSTSSSSKSPLNPIEIKKKTKKEIEEERSTLYYPDLNDSNFNEKLLALKEIRVHKISQYSDINSVADFEKKASDLCKTFDKSSFQYLIAHYLSYRTPYKSLLLYYSVGVGKTCTAITIAEGILYTHSSSEEPVIWVILPGAIEAGFKRQIFDTMKMTDFKNIANQCTGETYIKLAQLINELDIKEVDKRIKKIIKSRYRFFTYDGFASYIETNYIQKGKNVNNKLIIVDEAHNIRSSGTDNDENKRVYNSLMSITENGLNNRLVLLTATPMYNEPYDIYNLFLLLLRNDKREYLYDNTKIFDANNNLNPKAIKFISLMSSNYISYLRGKNPFNFAFKLSPSLSGYKLLDTVLKNTENGTPIPETDKDWIKYVEDGIITSDLCEKQLEYLSSKDPLKEKFDLVKNNFSALQPMNIVYDTTIGKEGFNNIFIKTNDKEQIKVRYNDKYNNMLSPDKNHLGKYSGKFLLLSDIIRKTKGIVLIYSRYIYSGVIPLGIMLEHMGFSRLNSDNLLDKEQITHNTVYDNIPNPKYCILSSSDPEIMGNTTIDNLMKVINNPLNKNGELVKVVLMTPVAGEGLNFMNIREIHLLESWYHFNRVDQIIGRGIRNCSHKTLPLEERNVTVFMHCGINGYERETADVHAFRISARKLHQSFLVDEIIRNNALDCSLFKSINYFPKELFKLGKIDIITSQGAQIKYELGDEDKFRPVCKIDIEKIKEDSLGFREETYKHLSLNIKNKIKELVIEGIDKNERFYSYEYLKEVFKDVDIKILMYAIKLSIYPNILIDKILILPHAEGIHIIDVIEDKPLKITLIKEIEDNKEDKAVIVDDNIYKTIEKLDLKDNYHNAVISLYRSLDEINFKLIINKIFSEESLNDIDKFIEECFINEGIIITKKEIPNYPTDNKHIGFVNIYNEEFEPLLFSKDGNHKNFTPKLLEAIKSNRIKIIKPDDLTKETLAWGLMIPIFKDKEKKNKINIFKLLTPGINYGKKTGIVCTSLQKKQHIQIFNGIGLDDTEKNSKETFCYKIAVQLYKLKRLTLLPEYKPK
jgi:hypothetical protein